jgi:malonyl-CoA/methylmalonyl-CoA synthetase
VVNFCREDLAGYKKPREVAFVDTLPRNALGKILKHEVRDKLMQSER